MEVSEVNVNLNFPKRSLNLLGTIIINSSIELWKEFVFNGVVKCI